MKSLCLLDSSKIGEKLKTICEIITIGRLRTFAMAKGKELPSSLVNWPSFRVTPDLRGCPPRKNWYGNHFKGKHGKLYISLERLINIDYQKNMCH